MFWGKEDLSGQCSFIGDEHYAAYQLSETERRCRNSSYENNNRCRFHLKEYVENDENRDVLIESLKNDIARANSSGERLMWIGYYIPKDIIFEDDFEGILNLAEAHFLGSVDFSRLEFRKEVNFRGATFNGEADFREAIFNEQVDFHRAVFNAKADFSSTTTFNKDGVFHSAVFHGEADFSYTTSYPSEDESNYHAKFRGKAIFFAATFDKDAEFFQRASSEQNFSLFHGEADYMYAKFHGFANFNNASAVLVGGSLQLTESPSFNDGARFLGTVFDKVASFGYTIFNGSTDFSYADFKKRGNFYHTRFKEVNFSEAKFEEETNFSNAQFNAKANFSNAQFYGRVDFIENTIMENMIFTQVLLKDQGQVTFNGNLASVAFANTDITRVRFGDKVRWRKVKRNSKDEKLKEDVNRKKKIDKIKDLWYGEENHYKIYDECILEGEEEGYKPPSSLESIITEYRNLRENYEYNLRYKEAGQFFIREMELGRIYEQKPPSAAGDNKINKKHPVKRWLSFANLYYIISKYGESPKIPLAIIVSTFIVATGFFFGFEQNWSWETFTNSLSRTLEAFFPFFNFQEDRGLGDMILRATMLPMVGLLFITLRRKLERRFRH